VGLEKIRNRINELGFSGARIDLSEGFLDAQKSENNGVIIAIHGVITLSSKCPRAFVQTFFIISITRR